MRPAATFATGVVVTSSAIASTFEVEKLLPAPSGPALTVVCPTPTSAVERYESAWRSASSHAMATTATTHARNSTFQRHRARRYPARSVWPVTLASPAPPCSASVTAGRPVMRARARVRTPARQPGHGSGRRPDHALPALPHAPAARVPAG